MAQEDVLKKIIDIEVRYDSALEQIATYQSEIDAMRQKMAELKKEYKDGAIGTKEYQTSIAACTQAIKSNQAAIGVLTKQVQNQLRMEQSQDGSIKNLKANLSNLIQAYDNLSRAERNSAKGVDMLQKIDLLTKEINEAEESTKRFSQNVGNYGEALVPVKQQLRELTETLIEMKANGLDNSAEFQAMMEQAGNLKDAMGDVSAQIGALSSDTAQLDSAAQGISALVNMYTIWQSATKAVGVESESLDRIMNGIMATLAVVNSMQQIQNALQKQSALVRGIDAAKTWLQNTALGAHMAALTAESAATGKATVATWLWNAALYANPLVWLIGLVMAAVAAVAALTSCFGLFSSGSAERKKALEEEGKELEHLQDLHRKQEEILEAQGENEARRLKVKADNLREERSLLAQHFIAVAKEYDDDEDEYTEALENMRNKKQEWLDELQKGQVYLTKIQANQREAERKAALGEFEYKRELLLKEAEAQMELALMLYQQNQITAEQYKQLCNDIKASYQRLKKDIDSEEKKDIEKRAKSAADEAKKKREQQRKNQRQYLSELQAAEDAILATEKDSIEKRLKQENNAYKKKLQTLKDKLLEIEENENLSLEDKLQMRAAVDRQIEALEIQTQQNLNDIQYNSLQSNLKLQQEMIDAKLDIIRKGTEEEFMLHFQALQSQQQLEENELSHRLEKGELSETEYQERLSILREQYKQKGVELAEKYDQIEIDRQKDTLRIELENLQLAEDERELQRMNGYKLEDDEYAQWRERGLQQMDEHQAEILLKQEENAQAELEAIIARGQLSTQTEQEFQEEIIAAKKKSFEAQKKTNEAIIANEKAKSQAMKAITGNLIGLLDTLGESNEAFAKLSKMIALAEIAVDTGVALSRGIKSAAEVKFPGNIVAIATTVATILANITTAISTVKSAKFAEGGKVSGPGSATSDSIPAMLSNGEFVVTAAATRLFEPLLLAMNNIGKGVPMQVVNSSIYQDDSLQEKLTLSFSQAAKYIQPIVSVVEINEAQERVKMIETRATV